MTTLSSSGCDVEGDWVCLTSDSVCLTSHSEVNLSQVSVDDL